MNLTVSHRRALQMSAGMCVALALPIVHAHEFLSSNFTVHHPWTRASAEVATSAIVTMQFESVAHTNSPMGAQSPVCDGPEFGSVGVTTASRRGFEFKIEQAQPGELTDAGTFLRLTGLNFPLVMGREYPLTLIFCKVGSLNAALLIDYSALGWTVYWCWSR